MNLQTSGSRNLTPGVQAEYATALFEIGQLARSPCLMWL
jgi:hypothetical protein